MNKIKLLPENLISQIAAGEVIEKPSSIVKELVENSIDAGSTKVEVAISNNCRNIRVSDNGHGIGKEDVTLAFSRHATSKLSSEKDLWTISTLGFRGEALASIISVSKVECLTRTAEAANGIRVECENSNIVVTETGCAVGTIMEVKELFYNVPARMKFLKKPQTEFAAILEILQGIAISNPAVSIVLLNKGTVALKTSGVNDLSVVISEIYSKELISELKEIYKEDNEVGLVIQGFSSNPDFTRSNKKAIYTFVNGRIIKCPVLLKAVDTSYKDLIPSGRYPFVVLNLNIPTNEIDINVHPAKREVRYSNPNQIFNFVHSSIKLALEDGFGLYKGIQNVKQEEAQEEILETSLFKEESSAFSKNPSYNSTFSSNKLVDFKQMKAQIDKSQDFYSPLPVQSKIDLLVEEPSCEPIIKPKIIGQYFNTYILIETEEGLQIVDQHIAHERTIYEKLKSSKTFDSQLVLISSSITLEPEQFILFEENKGLLSKYGYEFEFVEDSSLIIKQLPQVLAKCVHEQLIGDIIEALESDIEHIENKILITTACHSAVKAGEKLSLWQMEELIIEWKKSSFPKTCPHGRVISHIIPLKEVARFFGRSE